MSLTIMERGKPTSMNMAIMNQMPTARGYLLQTMLDLH